MASSLGGALFPLAVGSGIEQLGWRQTVLLTGIGVGLLMLGSVWLLLRDGRQVAQPPPTSSLTTHQQERVIPLLLTRRFAAIVFATGSLWFIIIALTQHQSIHLATDVGLARSTLPSVFSLFFGSSVVGKLCFGLLSDRFDLHRHGTARRCQRADGPEPDPIFDRFRRATRNSQRAALNIKTH
jgi:sugar phosphate permease